ncbi:MAG: tetratricopeptide repeat protein [Acidobacteria bacterium]|nr:tetratricopeptide repeat protein [Acidobacteriota bacterium]
MKTLLAIVFLALSSAAFAQQEDPRIAEGVALHDAGKYDEAIAKYDAVLADHPDDVTAAYELGYAYEAKGDHARCIATLQALAARSEGALPRVFDELGNCLDSAGRSERAVAAYRKGLALAPENASLQYNLALTLARLKQYDEARGLLKKELTTRPAHLPGRFLLANVFEAQGFRIPAIVEYLRFLSIDSSSSHARAVGTHVLDLFAAGVEVKDKKHVNITVDMNAPKDEGDFGPTEMMMALLAGSSAGAKKGKKSAFEEAVDRVAVPLSLLAGGNDTAPGSYTTTQNLPFFAALAEKDLLNAFAGVALSSVGLDGTERWMQKNAAAVAKYRAFVAQQQAQ